MSGSDLAYFTSLEQDVQKVFFLLSIYSFYGNVRIGFFLMFLTFFTELEISKEIVRAVEKVPVALHWRHGLWGNVHFLVAVPSCRAGGQVNSARTHWQHTGITDLSVPHLYTTNLREKKMGSVAEFLHRRWEWEDVCKLRSVVRMGRFHFVRCTMQINFIDTI